MAPRGNRHATADEDDITPNLQGSETVLGRSQYLVIILGIGGPDLSYVRTFSMKVDAPTLLRLRLVVDTKADHRSYLRILGATRRYPALTDDNPDTKPSFSLRLGLKALTLLEYQGTTTGTTGIPGIAQDVVLAGQAARGELMTGMARVKGSEVLGTGLLQQGALSLEATKQVDAIKAFLLQTEPVQLIFLFRHREAMGQDFAELANRLDQESRANSLAFTSQLAFNDFGEYVTVLGFAAIQEYESEEKIQSSLRDVTVAARFITIPGVGERRYFGFLDLQVLQGRIATGDSMKINFGMAGDPEEIEWTAYVTESLPVTPNGATTIILCRPREENDQGVYVYKDDRTVIKAVESHFNQDQDLAAAILASPPRAINIRWITTSLAVRRQIVGLSTLQDGRSERHLAHKQLSISRRLDLQATKDLYEGISDPGLGAYLQGLSLSPSQLRGLTYFRAIPHGLGLIQGPLGTGKTHLICQSLLPLLRFPSTEGRAHKILLLSPSNDPINDLSATLIRAITAAGMVKRVVRLHTWATEEEMVKTSAQRAHPREQVNHLIDDLEPAVAAMEAAVYLSNWYRAIIDTPLGIRDPRVRQLETSLSYLMLKVSGIIPGHNTELEQTTYATFRDGYHQYGEGKHENMEQATKFAQQLKDLREYSLSTCDAIVTTCSNSVETYLVRSFVPDVTYIDEAAKATELDLVIPMAHYPARVIILAGDDQQLRPTVLTDHVKDDQNQPVNCFAPQLTRSPFNRFRHRGLPVIREQFRMTVGLAQPASRISYKNRLIDAEGTALALRPQSQMFLRWTQTNYPETIGEMPALLLNVRDSRRSSVGTSAMNLDTAAVEVNTVISLLEYGFPAHDVAVIVFYQAQSEMYKVALRLASQALHNQALQDVRVKKVDGYQGGEASIVVLDFAITSVPGFVRDRNRLNVAITRQRDGLVVIADEAPIIRGIEEAHSLDFAVLMGYLGYDPVNDFDPINPAGDEGAWDAPEPTTNPTITPTTTTTTTTRTTAATISTTMAEQVVQITAEEGGQDVRMAEVDLSAFPDGNDTTEETGEGSERVQDDHRETVANDGPEQPGPSAKPEGKEVEIKSKFSESDESTESETTEEQAQQDESEPMDQTE
ncbi:MAG: hypothetical protein M1826_001357 [Phylliscum demangeonii]|nr:MAG: hypothetical protein M1826_001357 [Phylliscum demangeonii]